MKVPLLNYLGLILSTPTLISVTVVGCLVFQSASAAEPAKPDVLFIAIDDMNDWTTLFDSENPIQTPNLKRLAARGAFFTNAYCASPSCNPSRTAVLTGLRPTTSGVYANPHLWRLALPDAVSLPRYFGDHGYLTQGGGKIFHHDPANGDDSDNRSFKEFFPMKDLSVIDTPRGPVEKHFPTPKIREGARAAADWGPVTVPLTDDFTMEWAEQKLAEAPSAPRFLAVGLFHPHAPHFAHPSFFEAYPFESVVQPPMPPDDLDDVPPLGVRLAQKGGLHRHFFGSEAPPDEAPGSLRNLVRGYQASASYADANVGRLLDALDASGRADKTIIVLWSDHGYHLGDKQSTVKFTLWEKANHVPLIIVAPGITEPGTRIEHPVGLVNLYKTLADLAGLPVPEGLDGESLVPLLENPEKAWERPAIMTQGRGNHAIRSRDWRYIRYKDGTEELYEVATDDPWNHRNLLVGEHASQYSSIVDAHRKWIPEEEAAEGTVVQYY